MICMVFDVESIGLHGEGFAVGYTVVDDTGKELDADMITCPRGSACGTDADRDWVDKNIPDLLKGQVQHPIQVREIFWSRWENWKKEGAVLFADCAWPVEARFLIACIDDGVGHRNWDGPYPLHDIASVLLAKGKDPLAKFPRLENELSEHNPLCDARQSARILLEALKA